MKRKLIQVDFYPDGRVVKFYEGQEKPEVLIYKVASNKEVLQNKLEQFKKEKNSK